MHCLAISCFPAPRWSNNYLTIHLPFLIHDYCLLVESKSALTESTREAMTWGPPSRSWDSRPKPRIQGLPAVRYGSKTLEARSLAKRVVSSVSTPRRRSTLTT